MNPEGESIKPGDEDEDGSKDIDTEDIDSDRTEGDENEVEEKVEEPLTRPALQIKSRGLCAS
jgi:hypothetical protein